MRPSPTTHQGQRDRRWWGLAKPRPTLHKFGVTMAKSDSRQRTTWGTRFRFLVRFIGVTGLLATIAGALALYTVLPSTHWTLESVRATGEGARGAFAQYASWTLASGVAAVAIALLVELIGGLALVTGRRTAANATATVGTIAAVALLVIVNLYSFTHHLRYDATRDRRYTLPPDLVERFSKLRSETPTTIVVLQMHKTFGTLTDKRDSYTSEAERVVTEKVKDLVDLFREFGPRFNVVVLDTEAFGYDHTLANLTKDAPELKTAIDIAPENSIFFHANKRVQRLSFNEFLQLDKTASKEAEGGRGNLVILPQGEETFARRILAVQERRPKVALAVVHELLTSAHPEGRGKAYTLAGMREALTNNGFDVVDIVLKKNWATASSIDDLKPTADTREESRLERLEGELAAAQIKVSAANRTVFALDGVMKEIDKLKGRPWSERNAAYRQMLRVAVPEDQEAELIETLAKQLVKSKQSFEAAQNKAKSADAELQQALKDERPVEDRRIADAKEKLTKKLADVDLLILPRFTLEDASEGEGPDVPARLHGLQKEQIDVIRDFMVSGKPVLACLGPISGAEGPSPDGPDGFEKLLAERGIALGSETIIFDGEEKAFAARIAGEQFGGGVPSDIPPLAVVQTTASAQQSKPNPIAAADLLTARSVNLQLDLRKKALRPISLMPGWQDRIPFSAEFLFTSADCWNEQKPFMQTDRVRRPDGRVVRAVTYIPEFEATPVTDRKWGTPLAVRKGPFSIGVAIESKVPASWIKEDYTPEQFIAGWLMPWDGVLAAGLTVAANQLERKTERLVVFGSGNLFNGARLEPPEEKLLLHTVNWLTGRDDRLPRADRAPWSYPRVEMSEQELFLWQWGAAVGLPLVVVYFGIVAMMVRRLR